MVVKYADKQFAKSLMDWYAKNARDLPWRRTKDPYKIWVSEIMLQQTTVKAVIPYYEKWIKIFPTIHDLAKAPLQKVLKAWQGLGYYSRARNLHTSAKIIVKNYRGQIPRDPVALRALPGFGPYTVGAVLSIAFDQRVPIIDANVRRVLMRHLAIEGKADTSHDQKLYKFLDEIMPLSGNNIFNQAMMELGAKVCRSREPLCSICPTKKGCQAYEKGIQEIIPTPKQQKIKDIEAAIAVIKYRNKYFIQKRPSKGLLADLWEFPGGKIEKGETPQKALRRELKEELNADLTSAKLLMTTHHFYTQFHVKLHVFNCILKNYPQSNPTRKWVSLRQLANYPMPSGSAKIVEKLIHT